MAKARYLFYGRRSVKNTSPKYIRHYNARSQHTVMNVINVFSTGSTCWVINPLARRISTLKRSAFFKIFQVSSYRNWTVRVRFIYRARFRASAAPNCLFKTRISLTSHIYKVHDANPFFRSYQIPHILWNPKVHDHAHLCSAAIWIQSTRSPSYF